MTDPNQPLDLILAALKTAEPSADLEQRLLTTIATHRTAAANPADLRSTHLLHRLSPLPTAAAFSLAAAFVFAVSLAFLHHRHAITAQPAAGLMATPSASSTSPIKPPSNSCCHSERSEEPPHFALGSAAQRLVDPASQRRMNPVSHRHVQGGASAEPASHLASFPAPPLPLTEQEKLLLRVARARNPQQSPILNPTLRASLAAREDESFQVFFAPATTIKPYEPTN